MASAEAAPDSGAQDDPHQSTPSAPGLRLTLVISHLQMGGAERVLTELANHWASLGWTVTIINFSLPGTPPVFTLDPRVAEISLGLHRNSRTPVSGMIANVRRLAALRRAIKAARPEVVLSLMNRTNVLTVLSMTGAGVPVIVSEHTAPRGTLGLVWRTLREVAYRRAAAVVMLTSDALDRLSPAIRRHGHVIPNPLPFQFVRAADDATSRPAANEPELLTIMGLGRLTPEKGYDLLIQAFARVAPSWPTARLVIWGEGHERLGLERLRDSLGLRERIALPGATRNPERELQAATIFVLSSRLEGMPMTLLEAMALGRPVIACDCDHGPRDIVTQGVDGVLVPPEDVDALAEAIDGLLRDEDRRARLGRHAVEVRDRFAIGAISAQWEQLFHEVRTHQ
jgi:glycosyltransferase involved in cell wall biosynthesis